MKKIITIASVSALLLASCGNPDGSAVEGYNGLTSQADSVSYYIGSDIANNFKNNNIDRLFSVKAFNKGVEDGFAGGDLIISKELGNSIIMDNLGSIRSDSSEFTYTTASSEGFTSLVNRNDSISYFLGTDISSGLAANGFDKHFSKPAFFRGIEDGFMGREILIDKETGESIARNIMELEKESIMEAQKAKFQESIDAGEAFLKAKSAEEDVVTLPSGLRYKIITKGTGAIPTPNDMVTAHYHGTLIDGTVFDSSVERGEPVDFPVMGVIKGWTEALQLMPVGSKWELYIPYDLAYGEQGAGGSIAPYSTLIFEVELVKIKPAETTE